MAAISVADREEKRIIIKWRHGKRKLVKFIDAHLLKTPPKEMEEGADEGAAVRIEWSEEPQTWKEHP
jgi:hypothetical protein